MPYLVDRALQIKFLIQGGDTIQRVSDDGEWTEGARKYVHNIIGDFDDNFDGE
jgi:hypothetical protein